MDARRTVFIFYVRTLFIYETHPLENYDVILSISNFNNDSGLRAISSKDCPERYISGSDDTGERL